MAWYSHYRIDGLTRRKTFAANSRAEGEHSQPQKVLLSLRRRLETPIRFLVIALSASALGCASVGLNELTPSGQWYVVPNGEPIEVYKKPDRSARAVNLYPYDRYQIVSVEKRFYGITTYEGQEYYFSRRQSNQIKTYDPYTYHSPEKMVALHRERVNCSQFSGQGSAQAAFAANPSGLAALDADGDGQACEHLRQGRSRGKRKARTFTSSRGGSTYVKGHWRTTKSGKRVYVRPHKRKNESIPGS